MKKTKKNTKKEKGISEKTNLNEIIINNPQAADVFEKYGLHCIGCSFAGGETLEQGAQVHGMSKKMIKKMVDDVNKVVKKSGGKKESVEKKQIINITEKAAAKVADLIKESPETRKYLRIAIVNDRYGFKFEKMKKPQDEVIEKNGTLFLVDKENAKKMKGSTLDYLPHLSGSGFKVTRVMI